MTFQTTHLPLIATEVFTRLPDKLRIHDRHTPWTSHRGGAPLHSFLEGPSFDREGHLYCVDVAHGRIFRISPEGQWTVFADYGGNPNGLKIHRDGRIFVADHALGLLVFDPRTGERLATVAGAGGVPFRGLNDLVFADNGDLYLTDPGESALDDLHGRVLRMDAQGVVTVVLDGLAYPNGLAISPAQDALHVAISRTLQVLRGRIQGDRTLHWAVQMQLSGGLAGPDGMAVARDGSLAVVHAGFGTVWLTDALGEINARVRSCAGIRTTNVAFGVADPDHLYITEAEHGVILRARVPMTGRPLFSHRH